MYPGAHLPTHADRAALVMADTGERVTYAELEDRSVRLAHVLHDAGLRPGDCVALLSPNDPRYYDAYWAALRSGLYLTAINVHLSLAEQAHILSDCGAKAFVVSRACGERAEELTRQVPGLELRLAFGEGDPLPRFDDYDQALAAASDIAFDDQRAGGDMLYSSGTTGMPKAIRAPLPERQVTEPGDMLLAVFGRLYGLDSDTVYLSPADAAIRPRGGAGSREGLRRRGDRAARRRDSTSSTPSHAPRPAICRSARCARRTSDRSRLQVHHGMQMNLRFPR